MSGGKFLVGLAILVVAGLVFVLKWGDGEPEPYVPAPAVEAPRSVAPAPTDRAPAPGETPPVSAPAVVEIDGEQAGVVEVDLTDTPDFYSMLQQLGIEDVEERLAEWGVTRGYPMMDDQGNPVLDQPYDQYDEATLKAFADGGDMWAQQILAERIAASRPAEALELYRQAAVNGSVHAMTEMARLYKTLASSRSGDLPAGDAALEQVYALQDGSDSLTVTGYAWAAVAEKAGWDPLRGGMTAAFVGARLNDEQIKAACDFADTLYGDLVAERDDRGQGAYDSRPPPVVFDPGATGGTACNEDVTESLAGCKEIRVRVADQVSRVWTCDQ